MESLIIVCAKYLIVVPIILALYVAYRHRARLDLIVTAIIAMPLSYLVAKIASHLYFDPRPFVVQKIAPLIPHAADNGFPSDHALLAAALATLISLVDRRLGAIAWIAALLIGFSRVAAHVHHVRDIAASVLIALIVIPIVFVIVRRMRPDWGQYEENFMIRS